MGNCLRTSKQEAAAQAGPAASPAGISTECGWQVRCCQDGGGGLGGGSLSLHVDTAFYAANSTNRVPSFVHKLGPTQLLIAQLEGVGDTGDWVSATAKDCVLQAYEESASQYPGATEEVAKERMRATVQRLEARLLGCSHLAGSLHDSGCAIAVALVDLRSGACTVANVGHVRCLLARVTGAFNSKRPQAEALSTLHTTANEEERARAARRGDSAHIQPRSGGAVGLTRVLGAAEGRGKGPVGVDVVHRRLTPGDAHLVLASSSFCDVVSPAAVALRAHLFDQMESQREAELAAAASHGNPPSPGALQGNTAEHLLRYALSRIADRASARSGRSLTADDLQALPFRAAQPDRSDFGTEANVAGRTEGKNLGDALLGEHALIRRDVHGDLSCCVVSLHWAAEQGRQAAPRPAPRLTYSAALSRRRWAQVRLVADFTRLYRRELLRRLGEVADAALLRERVRAKLVSERLRLEQGLDKSGSPLPPNFFDIRASSAK